MPCHAMPCHAMRRDSFRFGYRLVSPSVLSTTCAPVSIAVHASPGHHHLPPTAGPTAVVAAAPAAGAAWVFREVLDGRTAVQVYTLVRDYETGPVVVTLNLYSYTYV